MYDVRQSSIGKVVLTKKNKKIKKLCAPLKKLLVVQ